MSVGDIRSFKRDHELAPTDAGEANGEPLGGEVDELDLRAEDDALVAAALEAEAEADDEEDEPAAESADSVRQRRRRRWTSRAAGAAGAAVDAAGHASPEGGPLEGTFDHGEDGYGLWLDPAVQDDPVYAEHWAGHRPVTVTVEAERIVITRVGTGDDD